MQTKYSSFNANNGLNSKSLFNERLKYQIGLFDLSFVDEEQPSATATVDVTKIPKPMKKFFVGEFQFYGKVDYNLNPITPKREKLKSISKKNNYFVLDFVQKQYNLMAENFNKCLTVGNISKDDPYLSIIKPFKAYSLFDSEYEKYINNNIVSFHSTFVKKRLNQILNFENYVDALVEYNNINAQKNPMTKTGFIKSNYCPINVTGLVIEIADLQYSVDSVKVDFTQSPNFEFFMKSCIKYGFFIDYQAPWRIIADLDSPVMIDAMESLGYSRATIFQTHYDSILNSEIQNIKNIFFKGYSSLVSQRPIQQIAYTCKNNTKVENITRPQINRTELNQVLNDSETIKMYVKMRLNEQNSKIPAHSLNEITNNSNRLLLKFDTNSVVNYIETEISPFERLGSGTLNSIVIGRTKRNRG